MKKLLFLFTTSLLFLSYLIPFSACYNPYRYDPWADDDSFAPKTQLIVYNQDQGINNAWLNKVVARFEDAYKDYEFEPDKKGVEVIVNQRNTGANFSNLELRKEDLFFLQDADITGLINGNKVMDVNDLITTPLNEYLDGKTNDTDTIEQKLYPSSREFFSYKLVDGKPTYFGLPHYSRLPVLVYNKAFFDAKGLYFAKTPDYGMQDGAFISADNRVKSCGPDGIYNTEDDGLPATWEEVFELFEYITAWGAKPLIWSGEQAYIKTKHLLTNIYINLAGKNNAKVNWTFDSDSEKVEIVTGFDDNGQPIVDLTEITPSNSSDVNKLFDKWQTIDIFDRIIDDKRYLHETCIDTYDTTLRSLENFILSANKANPIAILVDDDSWYYQAQTTGLFDQARLTYYDYDKKNDYQIMPLPRFNTGRASDVENLGKHKSVVTDISKSFACINANLVYEPEILEVAKLFLAFCYTEESLAEFTETTGAVRLMNYDVNEMDLSEYGQKVWEYVKNSDVVLPYSNQDKYLTNIKDLSLSSNSNFWKPNYELDPDEHLWSVDYNAPWYHLRGYNKTAVNYFTELTKKEI